MTILDQIINTKRDEIKALYQNESAWQRFSTKRPRHNRFKDAFKDTFGVIAEVKKASPSKGVIRADFDPVAIAKAFEQNGARALSVLTDRDYFKGSPTDLSEIRQSVNLPLLRKEFIIDPIQIWESVALGADAILLIQAILPVDLCQTLIDTAHAVGLDVLLEIHTPDELDQALQLNDLDLIGINNRNLATFDTDITLANRLCPRIKQSHPQLPVIAESGYHRIEELYALKEKNFAGVLIGEGLATNPNLEKMIGTLSSQ